MARQRGVSIPGDLSIACFLGTREGGAHFSGPRIDFEQLGRRAAAILKAPPDPRTEVRIETVWHEGRTIAPPKA